MGQLEAELLAPDITADMYEQSASQRKGDRHWTTWLQGLMAPDVEGQRSKSKSASFCLHAVKQFVRFKSLLN